MKPDPLRRLFAVPDPDIDRDVGSLDRQLAAQPIPTGEDPYASLPKEQRQRIAAAAMWAAGLVAHDQRACEFLGLLLDEMIRGLSVEISKGGLDHDDYKTHCGQVDGITEVKRLLTDPKALATIKTEMLGPGGVSGY